MSRISRAALLAFVAATLAGSCLHFVHALFPSGLTALLAPVNESIWEHLKILVWPCALGSVPLLRREPDSLGARAFSLLLAAGLMLGAGWLYHGVLGGHALLFDVVLYVLCMAVCFLLPALLGGPFWRETARLWCALAAALMVLMLVFTWLPPGCALFQEFPEAGGFQPPSGS